MSILGSSECAPVRSKEQWNIKNSINFARNCVRNFRSNSIYLQPYGTQLWPFSLILDSFRISYDRASIFSYELLLFPSIQNEKSTFARIAVSKMNIFRTVNDRKVKMNFFLLFRCRCLFTLRLYLDVRCVQTNNEMTNVPKIWHYVRSKPIESIRMKCQNVKTTRHAYAVNKKSKAISLDRYVFAGKRYCLI